MTDAPPSVLFAETEAFESFLMFAAALRRRGVRVQRLTVRPADRRARLRTALQRTVYHRIDSTLDPQTADGGVERHPDLDAFAGCRALEAIEPVARGMVRKGAAPGRAKTGAAVDPAILYDKLAMTNFARDLGLGVPETWSDLEQVPTGRPVVVKRGLGLGGAAVTVVQQDEHVRSVWSSMARDGEIVFAQEYVPGPVFSVGGVARQGEIVTAACYESRPAAGKPLGPSARVRPVGRPAAVAAAARLVGALGYTGMFCFDYVGAAEAQPLLIDVNARVFGSWAALQCAGLDLTTAYLYAHDLRAEPPANRPPVDGWQSTSPFNGLLGREDRHRLSDLRDVRSFTRALGWRWLVVRAMEVVATRDPKESG